MDRVDVRPRLDREREMVQAGRVELERLSLRRLPERERPRPRSRKPQVVDLLAALALDEEGLREPEGPKTAR